MPKSDAQPTVTEPVEKTADFLNPDDLDQLITVSTSHGGSISGILRGYRIEAEPSETRFYDGKPNGYITTVRLILDDIAGVEISGTATVTVRDA